MIKWDEKIKEILKKDNYNCIELHNVEEYNKIMESFPCQLDVSLRSNEKDEISSKNNFIKRLPYSACVPKIFTEIKEFVNNCAKFAEGLNSSQTELDDMIRKPTNKLITDRLHLLTMDDEECAISNGINSQLGQRDAYKILVNQQYSTYSSCFITYYIMLTYYSLSIRGTTVKQHVLRSNKMC